MDAETAIGRVLQFKAAIYDVRDRGCRLKNILLSNGEVMAAGVTREKDMPDSMHMIEIAEPGDAWVLRYVQRALPVPGWGEVLIRVHAAGINRPDIFQRKGLYPPPPGASDIPGLEVAGEVVALGEDVTEWQLGDRVCALLTGGGYAEYVLAPSLQCLPIPQGLSMLEAAVLPEACFTLWVNMFELGGLKVGENFLVHGGASGIGTFAIQMAASMGARVFATAGTDEKCRACKRLGATHAVNYRTEDFVEVLQARTAGSGMNLILDMVGGDYIQRNMELAAVGGRIVMIAFLGGSRANLNFAPVMLKRLVLTGSTLRPRTLAFKAGVAAELRQHIWPLIEAGDIKPQIYATFPLEAVADAHRLMERDEHIGKIVLEVAH